MRFFYQEMDMMEYLRSLQLGAAVVTIINVGNMQAAFTEDGHTIEIPVQSVLIQLPETNIVVDACLYELPQTSPYAILDYQPPPGLLARLRELDVPPEQIDHVIITHTHFDHYNGATEQRAGVYQPSFPNARYYIGKADLDDPEMQQSMQDSNSLAGRTLAVIERAGLVEPVTGRFTLNSAVEIIPAPGEIPGHQIVRVHSQGETLYCLGDLYHDAFEVQDPQRMADWADVPAMLRSRAALADAALAENARLIVTHIPGIGRLERNAIRRRLARRLAEIWNQKRPTSSGRFVFVSERASGLAPSVRHADEIQELQNG